MILGGQIALEEGWQTNLRNLDDENTDYICRHCITAENSDYAVERLFPDYYYYGNNYYRIRALYMQNSHPLLQKLRKAEHVCLYGLGKFFKIIIFMPGGMRLSMQMCFQIIIRTYGEEVSEVFW